MKEKTKTTTISLQPSVIDALNDYCDKETEKAGKTVSRSRVVEHVIVQHLRMKGYNVTERDWAGARK